MTKAINSPQIPSGIAKRNIGAIESMHPVNPNPIAAKMSKTPRMRTPERSAPWRSGGLAIGAGARKGCPHLGHAGAWSDTARAHAGQAMSEGTRRG